VGFIRGNLPYAVTCTQVPALQLPSVQVSNLAITQVPVLPGCGEERGGTKRREKKGTPDFSLKALYISGLRPNFSAVHEKGTAQATPLKKRHESRRRSKTSHASLHAHHPSRPVISSTPTPRRQHNGQKEKRKKKRRILLPLHISLPLTRKKQSSFPNSYFISHLYSLTFPDCHWRR